MRLLLLLLLANTSISSSDGDVSEVAEHLSKLDGAVDAKTDLGVDEALILSTTSHDEGDFETTTQSALHTPPTHFHITSHVQTNLATGVSYFLPPSQLMESYANIPFLECGAVGSTTEGVPLVSGVFRYVPNCGVVQKREMNVVLDDDTGGDDLDANKDEQLEIKLNGELGESQEEEETKDHHPKRPSPPRFIIALSPFQITVGGNGNQTQAFEAGDVVFLEDSWYGVWNDDDAGTDSAKESAESQMKGYVMRAHPDSKRDLNVLMLTVPPSVHRHWKHQHQQHHALVEEDNQSPKLAREASTPNTQRQPWWKLKLHRQTLPKPCSLESDPAFSHPAASSTTLSQHFTQHFVKLIKGYSNPRGFLPHQDLVLPILAQGLAGAVGAGTALGLVVQLWRMVNVQVAVGFGAACVVGLGTWGFVWLGEEILDELEVWSERRKLERRWSKKSEHRASVVGEEEDAA